MKSPACAHSSRPFPLGPAVAAAAASLYFTARFRDYLPISEGWAAIERVLFPLSALNLVFHEAGHWIFGILGSDFLMFAGGTLMQLLMPGACLLHFLARDNWAGVGAVLFWLGQNLVSISLYVADAKIQALILISGLSGREGGGHDWHNMLTVLGLVDHSVALGRIVFFFGCGLMIFPFFWAGAGLWRKVWSEGPEKN